MSTITLRLTHLLTIMTGQVLGPRQRVLGTMASRADDQGGLRKEGLAMG